jgi:hypothetical protein
VYGVSACPQLTNCVRIAGTQPGIAADPSAPTRGVQAGLGALGDQRTLELRNGT